MNDDKCKLPLCPYTEVVGGGGYCSQTHQVQGLAGELAELRRELGDVRREFDAYKARVRQEAIDASVADGWCVSGLNAALQRLGLEPHHPTRNYGVSVTFTATRTGTVPVTAPDEDEAFEAVQQMSTRDAFFAAYGQHPRNPDWDYSHEADSVDEQ